MYNTFKCREAYIKRNAQFVTQERTGALNQQSDNYNQNYPYSGAGPQPGPQQGGPYQGGPQPNGPYQRGPQQGGPYQAGPQQGGPYQGGPQPNAPYQAGPQQGGAYQGTPHQGGQRPQADYSRRFAGIAREFGSAITDVVNESLGAAGKGLSNINIGTRNSNVPVARHQPNKPRKPKQAAQAAGAYQRPEWFPQGQQGKKANVRMRHISPGMMDIAGLNQLKIPKGIVRLVFGILGSVVFGLAMLTFAILNTYIPDVVAFVPLGGVSGMFFAGSVVLANFGMQANRLAKRAEKYYALFDKKKVLTIEEVAGYTGETEKKVRKDITKMHKRGWLLDIFYDREHTCLMKGEDTYEQYLDSIDHTKRLQREEQERQQRLQNPETADIETFRSEGAATIRKIRAANDAIPGEEISDKLSRLEDSCARIFSYVEKHPDKLPDTRKFMDYYLPTTLKLVEKYREYEKMDYQPENVLEAKRQIESALGTIEQAYRNLLAGFYQPDTLDISTDIVVLQNMLEQEGLTGHRFDIDPAPGAPSAPAPVQEDDGAINLKL